MERQKIKNQSLKLWWKSLTRPAEPNSANDMKFIARRREGERIDTAYLMWEYARFGRQIFFALYFNF
jgi:hypothetical protein